MAKKSSGGGFGRLFVGFLVGIVVVGAAGLAYLRIGAPPVAVSDKAFPMEASIMKVPLQARIDAEKKEAPFGTSEDVFEGGAKVYREQCASCHGTPGHDVAYAGQMYPAAPQLWKKHKGRDVVGVSDDEAGETYWKVANGIRLSGMPSFKKILTDTQMWQVSLLLKNADKELPDPVRQILTAPGR